jgi:enoyl-CoA hydratase/carnithine racemase
MATWQVTYDAEVATVWLDDGKANAVLAPEFQSLEVALDEVAASPASAVILTGRPGSLSAGLDVEALPGLSMEE